MTTSEAPRVSVCIANFNGEAMLDDCIGSVMAQDTDVAVELIVHDDASTDGSLALLRERWPQVRVLESADNVGFCIANNRLADAARGDFVLLLNNDAALQPDAIRTLLSETGRIGEPAILTLPQRDWTTGDLVDRGCLLDPFYTPVPNLDPSRADVAYVIGACLWCPRPAWHALGAFPEWLGSIAEDMALCCAARLRGMPVRCVEGSGYRHRQGESFGGNRVDGRTLRTRSRRRYLSERNRMIVLVTCTPTWLAWPWLAAHVVVLAMEGVALAVASSSTRPWRRIYWPALRNAWKLRGKIIPLRRRLQAQRRAGLAHYLRGFVLVPRKLGMVLRHGLPRLDDR